MYNYRNYLLFSFLKKNIMQEGTVKFFNDAKGFGFITIKETGNEIFVHTSNLVDDIRENDKVSFKVEQGQKGLIATNVRRM
ncbi:cold-shock protein [Empedobacter brevis NBRC 14943 = ATCC 43319]|uniref:Cold-shock protein n=2 Tax=Empedobacter brevis TaxID=247 RepID=A0A511NF83_9FLAO|nr:cold-shock protein [Empedobacter brevis NBRC 14943 = ATCC 43319]